MDQHWPHYYSAMSAASREVVPFNQTLIEIIKLFFYELSSLHTIDQRHIYIQNNKRDWHERLLKTLI